MDTIQQFADWVLQQINIILQWFKTLADDIFTEVSDFLKAIWGSFTDLLKSLVLTLWDMLGDLISFIFDITLEFALFLLDGFFTAFGAMDILQYIDFPPDVENIMGLIGLGQCMSFIVTALTIRFLLQLIPFTRLGS